MLNNSLTEAHCFTGVSNTNSWLMSHPDSVFSIFCVGVPARSDQMNQSGFVCFTFVVYFFFNVWIKPHPGVLINPNVHAILKTTDKNNTETNPCCETINNLPHFCFAFEFLKQIFSIGEGSRGYGLSATNISGMNTSHWLKKM